MSKEVQEFVSAEFGKIGVLMIDGKPYFPATDCAAILGYKKPHDAISRHCRGSVKHGVIDSLGRTQEKIFIPEGDLYRIIMRSQLPAAERFEAFVCDVILPTIRRHGAYVTDETLGRMREDRAFTDELLKQLGDERENNAFLIGFINRQAPKVRYYDVILQSPTPVQISIIAKDYGMSAIYLNKLLHKLRIQFKMGRTWLLYREFDNKGYTITKTYLIDGGYASVHTCWTQKGRRFIYETLKQIGILPEAERNLDAAS